MTFIRTHIPCEHCGSRDGASLNEDGSTYCFVCAKHTSSDEPYEILMTKQVEPTDDSFTAVYNNGNSVSVSDRRITKATT